MERLAAALLLAAAAAPFWVGRFLPFLDLPQHLALAAVVARLGDPATGFARSYAIDPHLTPYWGYYGAMAVLARALPLELANRLLFTAHAVGLPLAAAFLLASFGRDRRWAVLTIPLVYSTNLFFGFASFLLSLPLFLVALGLTERHLAPERAAWGRSLALALAAAAVFLFHAQSYATLGLCVALLLALHARGLRWAAARALPYLPSLALCAPWVWRSFVRPERPLSEQHTANHHAYGAIGSGLGAVYEPFREAAARIPERLLGAFTDGSDARIGAALLALFAVALATGYGPAPASPDAPDRPGLREALRAHRPALLVLLLAATSFAAPMEISGQWYVSPRQLVFAALALPLLLARPPEGWRALLLAGGAALALAASVNTAVHIRRFQEQVGAFATVEELLPRGGRVLGLVFDRGERGPVRLWPFVHWACYAQVRGGGDVGFSFAGLPSIPVRYRDGMQAPHPNEWRPESFDPATARFYDAILVRGTPPPQVAEGLRRVAVRGASAGAWSLWTPRGLSSTSPAR